MLCASTWPNLLRALMIGWNVACETGVTWLKGWYRFQISTYFRGKKWSKSALLCNSSFLLRFQVSLKKKASQQYNLPSNRTRWHSPHPSLIERQLTLLENVIPFFPLRVSLSTSSWTCLRKAKANQRKKKALVHRQEIAEALENM